MSVSTARKYAAIVIGSGQSGSPLAIALTKAGYKTALVESTYVGGCCVNVGCTPTKTMIASGRMAYLASRMPDYGVHFSQPGAQGQIHVDMLKVRQRKRDIVNSFRGGSERRLKDAGVDVLMGSARFIGQKKIKVKLNDNQSEDLICEADRVFINVGERPAIPKLEGLREVISNAPERVLDSTTIQELGEVPEKLIVLGGGYVGLEFAQLFSRLGSKVHVIQRRDRLLPREDPELTESLRGILVSEGLEIHTSTETVGVSLSDGSRITVQLRGSDGKPSSLTGTHLLLAVGRQPNTDELDVLSTGLSLGSRGHVETNERLETAVEGIYALGDCRGRQAFTHVSYDDFRIIRDNLDLLPKPSASSLDVPPKPHTTELREPLIPQVAYTDPQFGHVGVRLHEIPASQRKNIQVAKMPMSYVARALETDDTRGMMKAVVNGQTGEILGFSCLGLEGGEIMSIVQTAMMGKLKWWQLREAVWAHPTLAESLNNLWGLLEDAPSE